MSDGQNKTEQKKSDQTKSGSSKSDKTKLALQQAATTLFWGRGYSNVSVREVAKQTGVDVALIGRYFGGKRGLFEATLETVIAFDPDVTPDGETLIDAIVHMFVNADRSSDKANVQVSPVTMVIMNAQDPEVGDLVRELANRAWHRPLEQIAGSKQRAALFSAALLGFSTIDKKLKLDGIADPAHSDYGKQMRCLLEAALAFETAPVK